MQVPAATGSRRRSRIKPAPPPRKGSEDEKPSPVKVVKKDSPPSVPTVARSPSTGGSHMVDAMVQIVPKPPGTPDGPEECAADGPPPPPVDLSSSPPQKLKKSTSGGGRPPPAPLVSSGGGGGGAFGGFDPSKVKLKSTGKKRKSIESKKKSEPADDRPPWMRERDAKKKKETAKSSAAPLTEEVDSRSTSVVSIPEDNGLSIHAAEEVAKASTPKIGSQSADSAPLKSVVSPLDAKSTGVSKIGGASKARSVKPSAKAYSSSAVAVISEDEQSGTEKEILMREISKLERQFGAKDEALKEITRQDVMHLLEEMEPIDVLLAMQDFMSSSDDLDALRVLNLALSDV